MALVCKTHYLAATKARYDRQIKHVSENQTYSVVGIRTVLTATHTTRQSGQYHARLSYNHYVAERKHLHGYFATRVSQHDTGNLTLLDTGRKQYSTLSSHWK